MGYSTFWSTDEPHTIIIRATPPKDWETFHAACDEAHTLAVQAGGPVGIVFDLTAAPEPAGRNALSNMRTEAARLTPQMVAVVAVGYGAMGRTLLQIMATVFGSRFTAADNIEQAYEIVRGRIQEARDQGEVA
jgi:hypothetical protein